MTESTADRLDEIENMILEGLKDFQRATVERIDEQYRQGKNRILVSDEVGLGKTLVARGTVAKLAKMRKEQGDPLVKVVYICSNAAIADQNLNKLKISQSVRRESTIYSRLSMQHLHIFKQENDPELLKSYIQLIPLTPETSFRTNGAGTVSERALMYVLLKSIPELYEHNKALERLMQGWASLERFKSEKTWYESEVLKTNAVTNGEYLEFMSEHMGKELSRKTDNNRTLLEKITERLGMIEENNYESIGSSYLIGQIRLLFARISLERLEPDLVIMDEFQRFKYLLNADPESEIGMLAGKFFKSDKVRMLLLSATPYKMYSTLEEIDENNIDEHFTEFLSVMKFLNITEEKNKEFREVWNNYSVCLKEISVGKTTLITAKKAAENAMFSSVCRTERILAADGMDIIDDSSVRKPATVSGADIMSYLNAQKLLERTGLNINVPIDYVKSSPYLLSFMRDYQLKRDVQRYFKYHPDEIGKARSETLWIKRSKIDQYEKIPYNNARLDYISDYVFSKNAELLLWVPPSKPYYAPEGVYKGIENFSKTLIFSSWEMVPRMISSLISYEAERLSVGRLSKTYNDRDVHYFSSEEKRYPPARLVFSVSGGTPNRMALFCLIYPSQFLTKCYDPLDCLNRHLSIREIEREIKIQIREKLGGFKSVESGRTDQRWYYIAPLLLDDPEYVRNWLRDRDALSQYGEEKNARNKGFITYLDALTELYEAVEKDRNILGRMPDDLADILADIAIASPAVCIGRTYSKYCKDGKSFSNFYPTQIARVFIRRMNTVESTAAVEMACGRKTDDAHWKNMLTYCKQGNIQAMFDEYAHMQANCLDETSNLIENLHSGIINSMSINTATYTVDTYNTFKARINNNRERPVNIRTHFAVAFTRGDNKESDTDRKKVVRNAFNSPFRPFVLASTSIGSEGLDFHNYCRRIVHWNLPSNPIDIEQREGRINRFECLAIRQNVAKRYGSIHFESDVWEEMFNEAERVEKTEESSDLIPYWGLKKSEDMIKIERIVPMYPLSSDENNYDRMIKILSLYRLTLGQARQEELLEFILNNAEDEEDLKEIFINLSPYFRKHASNIVGSHDSV